MKYRLLLAGLTALAGLAACKAPLHPQVRFRTDLGNITVELYPDKAPITANNFLAYVDARAFDGAVFYRVVRLDNQPTSPVKIEVIQGGLDSTHRDRRRPPIAHETNDKTGVKHLDGTLSMARSAPGTASSEFFFCINDQPELDFGGKRNPDGQGFAAFGRVVRGMGVVRKVQQGATGEGDRRQALRQVVLIREVRRRN
jgi:peptidyl-prolyl cis-trans isomerase A (cyclophilin A)